MQGNVASIKDLAKHPSEEILHIPSEFSYVKAVWYPRNENTEPRCEDVTGRKGRKEVPRTASCASASLQRGKNFPVASSEGRSVKGAVPGQENGKDRAREYNQAQKKKEVHHAEAEGNGALEGQSTLLNCTLSKKDVKASVVNAWQISSFCHFLVARPSCLTEPSVFGIVNPQGRSHNK